MGAIASFIAAVLGFLRSLKPQSVREGEDLGRAQASLDVVSQAQSVAVAEAQAVMVAPHDAFGVEQQLRGGDF